MADTVFDRLLLRGIRSGKIPARTAEAREWYRKKAAQSKVMGSTVLKEKARARSRIQVGRMYLFKYDAKTKDKLPYWDARPLIFPFAEEGKYFYGLNVHYLPPVMRAKLMDALYEYASDEKYDEKTKLRLSYKTLKAASQFEIMKPCVKKYLKSHVQSSFIEIASSEWDIALFLPIADWQKQSFRKVYHDARKYGGSK